MKQVINRLLQSIEAGATQKSHVHHANIVRQAFNAGAFDCLVEHPASEPPDNERVVLALMCYDGELKWRLNSHHLVHGEKFWMFYNWDVVAWRELPLMLEETK